MNVIRLALHSLTLRGRCTLAAGATAALSELDAVLIGGGPMPAGVGERAAEAGIRVVRTYGMSETAGGCVYDGVPLDGVNVRLDDGRIVRIVGFFGDLAAA